MAVGRQGCRTGRTRNSALLWRRNPGLESRPGNSQGTPYTQGVRRTGAGGRLALGFKAPEDLSRLFCRQRRPSLHFPGSAHISPCSLTQPLVRWRATEIRRRPPCRRRRPPVNLFQPRRGRQRLPRPGRRHAVPRALDAGVVGEERRGRDLAANAPTCHQQRQDNRPGGTDREDGHVAGSVRSG